MLDSGPMCAATGKEFEIPRSHALTGLLALLLRR
jgi:hypothetical protein